MRTCRTKSSSGFILKDSVSIIEHTANTVKGFEKEKS